MAAKAVPSSASDHAAHRGLQLIVKDGVLLATGSDATVTITTRLQLTAAKNGSLVLDPEALLKFLGALAPSTAVTVLKTGNGDLEIHNDREPYSFRSMAVTYPTPLTVPEADLLPADLSSFTQAVAAIRRSGAEVAQLRATEQEGLWLTTADDYHLSRVTIPGVSLGGREGVVPTAALEVAAKSEFSSLGIDRKSRVVTFAGPEVSVSAVLRAEPFPNLDSVLSKAPPSTVRLRKSDMQAAVARLAPIASGKPIHILFEDGALVLWVSNPQTGSGRETIEVLSAVPERLDSGCDLTYLADAVASQVGDEFEFSYGSFFFLRSTGALSVTSVIAPVRF